MSDFLVAGEDAVQTGIKQSPVVVDFMVLINVINQNVVICVFLQFSSSTIGSMNTSGQRIVKSMYVFLGRSAT